VFWQARTIGVDAGVDGARTMMLVYNLPPTDAIFEQFNGIAGAAYLIAGLRPPTRIWWWCPSVPASGYGLATTPAISNLRRGRPGTRSKQPRNYELDGSP
jgi:hypothetical protein